MNNHYVLEGKPVSLKWRENTDLEQTERNRFVEAIDLLHKNTIPSHGTSPKNINHCLPDEVHR